VGRIRREREKGEVKKAEGEVPALLTVPMSGESIKKLYTIQGLLNCATLDEAVDILFKDLPKIMAYKFRASLDFHGAPGEIFTEVVERAKVIEEATSPYNLNSDKQAKVLASMGLTWFTKGLYNLEGNGATLIQFMERKLLERYKLEGWAFKHKSRGDVIWMDPSVGTELTGDLVSIFSPKDKSWYFPKEEETYFGVQTAPISEKLAWINVLKTGVKITG
jgi:hypothetical protein